MELILPANPANDTSRRTSLHEEHRAHTPLAPSRAKHKVAQLIKRAGPDAYAVERTSASKQGATERGNHVLSKMRGKERRYR